MEIKLNAAFLAFALALVCMIAVLVGSCGANQDKASALNLLRKLSEEQEKVAILKHEALSLKEVIDKASEKNKQLLGQIAFLESKEEKVKYVEVIKYETKEIIIETDVLPVSHTYVTEEGLAICSFESGENFVFKVIPVEYKINIVKTNKTSSIKLFAKSKKNEKEIELPVNLEETETYTVRSYPKLDPHLQLSLGLDTSLSIDPVLSVPFLHLNESVAILSPTIAISENPKIGVNIIDYKISNHLPLLTDTWLGIGANRSFEKSGVQITIGSKF